MAAARNEFTSTPQAADSVAFTEMYRLHLGSVRAYASTSVAAADIDDVVSEVFALAWQRREDVPLDWARGWLVGVTRNVIRTRRRSARRAASYIDRFDEHRPTPAAGPDDAQLATERFDTLEAAMRTLRPADQEILMLAGPYEMSNGDIAAALDTSENNVGVRLHRARQRLRSAFDGVAASGGEVA